MLQVAHWFHWGILYCETGRGFSRMFTAGSASQSQHVRRQTARISPDIADALGASPSPVLSPISSADSVESPNHSQSPQMNDIWSRATRATKADGTDFWWNEDPTLDEDIKSPHTSEVMLPPHTSLNIQFPRLRMRAGACAGEQRCLTIQTQTQER